MYFFPLTRHSLTRPPCIPAAQKNKNISDIINPVEKVMHCPPLNELLDYARQLLTPIERERVALHLQTGCRACAENRQWLVKAVAASAAQPSYVFSETTLQGLVAWFRSQPAHELRSAPLLVARQMAARLLFDSFTQPAWAATRDGAVAEEAATERQMLFQAEGYDIDLRFEADEDQAHEDLIGQVLPQSARTATGVSVQLWQNNQAQNNQVQRWATADTQGFFKFAQIPRGAYDLRIQVAEGEINIAQLTTTRAA